MRYLAMVVLLFSLVSWGSIAAEAPGGKAPAGPAVAPVDDSRPVTVAERRADNLEIGKALGWLRSELLHTGWVVRHMAESTPEGKAAFEAAEKAWAEKLAAEKREAEQSAQKQLDGQEKRIAELEAELAKAKGGKTDGDPKR